LAYYSKTLSGFRINLLRESSFTIKGKGKAISERAGQGLRVPTG
jgi:hypothetical protein